MAPDLVLRSRPGYTAGMSRFPIIVLVALLSASWLAACGNKGPLVRPPVEDVVDEADTSLVDPAPLPEVSADEAADDVPVDDADDADEDGEQGEEETPPPPPPADAGTG